MSKKIKEVLHLIDHGDIDDADIIWNEVSKQINLSIYKNLFFDVKTEIDLIIEEYPERSMSDAINALEIIEKLQHSQNLRSVFCD